MKRITKTIGQLLAGVALAVVAGLSSAHTSIANIDGYTHQSWSRASNYESQKEADNDALEGCRVEARKNGLANLAKQCKIIDRATGPGYGALVCGVEGCMWATGFDVEQEAVDAAYAACSKAHTKCRDKNISSWEDFAGFTKKATLPKPTAEANCLPRSTHLQCTSACTNGSCVVTYQNGCQMRVQVQAQFNPMTNTWDYPAPSC